MTNKLFLSSSLLLSLLIGGCSLFKDENPGKTIINSCNSYTSALTSPASNEETEYNLEDLYDYAVTGTVTVLSYDSNYSAIASGSGVIIEENKLEDYVYIITNAHVVANGSKTSGFQTVTVESKFFEVIYHDNQRVSATVVAKSTTEDIAVLKATINPSNNYNVIAIADDDSVQPGQSVMAIGSPQGINYKNTATHGIVSNIKVKISADNDNDGTSTDLYLTQIDAAINPGNSGGPLFNMKGELIGINTMKLTKSSDGTVLESMHFAIPAAHAKLVADQLISTGSYTRPLLGITNIDIGDLSLQERKDYQINLTTGIYVNEVSSTGACNNKLNTGDIIIKINNLCIEDREDFCVELYKYISGQNITLTIVDKNGENQRTETITLK